jgi:tetratricopeptide (TPR) repeat protein
MPKPRVAPEIWQQPVADFDVSVLPAGARQPGTPEFEMAVISHVAARYGARGWTAAVTVDDEFVRVVALPEGGIQPKDYVLGLLQHGFLEDALPILDALDGMLDDPDIAYNRGICLSQLGRVAESLAPLERCVRLDPDYVNAWVGLGVAHARLGRPVEAEAALRRAIALDPGNADAVRNLGAVLLRSGRADDAVPLFREATALAPEDPGAALGLAQSLEQVGGEAVKEAMAIYAEILRRFPDHPVSDQARAAQTNRAHTTLHAAVGGALRMDAVAYMEAALQLFGAMPREAVGRVVLEIARLGEHGLAINDPAKRYTLQSLPGDFSGLQLLSELHVGMKLFDRSADTASGLDPEYSAALALTGSPKP